MKRYVLRSINMIYEKLIEAWNKADVLTYKSLHHDDWEFKFHSTGNVMRSADMSDQQIEGMMMNNKNENMRCIYENDDILVVHSFATFPSGDKEAVLMVHRKKNGLLWRTETGATPIS